MIMMCVPIFWIAFAGVGIGSSADAPESLLLKVDSATRAVTVLQADYTRDFKNRFGPRHWSGTVRVMRPNFVRVEVAEQWHDPVGNVDKLITPETYASDGKDSWELRGRTYNKSTVDANGLNLQMWRAMPLEEFFDPSQSRVSRIQQARAAGTLRTLKSLPDEVVDGIPCRVVEWTFADTSDMWKQFRLSDKSVPDPVIATERYYIGPDNLVHRVVKSAAAGNSSIENDYALHNIRTGTRLATVDFAYTPPATASAYVPNEHPPLLSIGTSAPNFTAMKPTGEKLDLASLKGKIVVLDFWATWCGPCLAAIPHLDAWHRAIKDQGGLVLALCVADDKSKFDQWVKDNPARFSGVLAFDPAGRDSSQSISGKLYKVWGLPTTYVIDRDGKVVEAVIPTTPAERQKVTAALRKLGMVLKDE